MNVALDIGLAALVVALALRIVMTREERTSIIGFVAYGLLLALVWVRLWSIDVALTEAAIGSGVTGLLLLRAEAHMRRAASPGQATGRATRLAAAVVCGLVAAALAVVVLVAPDPAPTLAPAAASAIGATGLGNPVTAVLMAYRALDTLLEKVVLLLAVLGVWSLAPERCWGGAPDLRPAEEPAPLLLLARTLPPVGIVVGIYMFWVGADEPGGAFQGGTLLAAMWILVMMAGLRKAPATGESHVRMLLAAGPIAFLAAGFAGFVLAGGFLAYPVSFAKPLILAIEAAMVLTIAVTLGLLAAGPPTTAPKR
jgi:multisubunit Na+/H+ antiporter MnhB subunit